MSSSKDFYRAKKIEKIKGGASHDHTPGGSRKDPEDAPRNRA